LLTVLLVFSLTAVLFAVALPLAGEALGVITEEGAVDARLAIELVAVVTAVDLAVASDAAVGAGAVIALDGAGRAAIGAFA